MATERPALDDLFTVTRPQSAPMDGRPPLDDLFSTPRKTKASKQAPSKAEKVPFLPVKDDIPGLAASAMHGVTQGLTDVGREPISKIVAGYPGEFIEKGMESAKKLPEIGKQFMLRGPAGAGEEILRMPVKTPESEFGFPVAPQPRSVTGKLLGLGLESATSGGIAKAGQKALTRVAPAARKAGVGMVRRMIRPTGEFAERGGEISEALLKEGLVRGDKGRILENVMKRGQELNQYLDDVMEQYKNRKISPEKAIEYMDEVATKYRSNAATDDVLNKVADVKKAIIERHGLKEPVYDDVESGQFLLRQGSDSKITAPKIIKKYEAPEQRQFVIKKGSSSKSVSPAYKNVPLAGRSKKPILEGLQPEKEVVQGDFDPASGINFSKTKRGDIPIGKRHLESPEDTVIIPKKNKQATVAYPKRENQVRKEDILGPEPQKRLKSASIINDTTISGRAEDVLGQSKLERKQIGEQFRPISVKDAQQFKKGQYSVSYDSDAQTPERMTRRAYARGLKQGVEEAIPEVDIAGTNRRIGDLSEAADVIGKRMGISERNNLIGLGDMVLAGSPPLAVGRKILTWDPVQALMARKLYGLQDSARQYKNAPRITAGVTAGKRGLQLLTDK